MSNFDLSALFTTLGIPLSVFQDQFFNTILLRSLYFHIIPNSLHLKPSIPTNNEEISNYLMELNHCFDVDISPSVRNSKENFCGIGFYTRDFLEIPLLEYNFNEKKYSVFYCDFDYTEYGFTETTINAFFTLFNHLALLYHEHELFAWETIVSNIFCAYSDVLSQTVNTFSHNKLWNHFKKSKVTCFHLVSGIKHLNPKLLYSSEVYTTWSSLFKNDFQIFKYFAELYFNADHQQLVVELHTGKLYNKDLFGTYFNDNNKLSCFYSFDQILSPLNTAIILYEIRNILKFIIHDNQFPLHNFSKNEFPLAKSEFESFITKCQSFRCNQNTVSNQNSASSFSFVHFSNNYRFRDCEAYEPVHIRCSLHTSFFKWEFQDMFLYQIIKTGFLTKEIKVIQSIDYAIIPVFQYFPDYIKSNLLSKTLFREYPPNLSKQSSNSKQSSSNSMDIEASDFNKNANIPSQQSSQPNLIQNEDNHSISSDTDVNLVSKLPSVGKYLLLTASTLKFEKFKTRVCNVNNFQFLPPDDDVNSQKLLPNNSNNFTSSSFNNQNILSQSQVINNVIPQVNSNSSDFNLHLLNQQQNKQNYSSDFSQQISHSFPDKFSHQPYSGNNNYISKEYSVYKTLYHHKKSLSQSSIQLNSQQNKNLFYPLAEDFLFRISFGLYKIFKDTSTQLFSSRNISTEKIKQRSKSSTCIRRNFFTLPK